MGPTLFFTAIFFLNFEARVILSPLMPTIELELGLSHGEAGSLFFLISLGYFITLLGSSFISSRLTHRKIIILSSTAVGLSLLGVSFASSLWGVRLGLFALGMVAGVYLPSGLATLTSLISPKHWGKGIAIHELAPNLGLIAAPIVSEALLGWISWRGILALIGVSSVLLGTAFACFGRSGDFTGESLNIRSFRSFIETRSFWIMMIMVSLGVSGFLGLYCLIPVYFPN